MVQISHKFDVLYVSHVTRMCHTCERRGVGLTRIIFVTKMHVHDMQEMLATYMHT